MKVLPDENIDPRLAQDFPDDSEVTSALDPTRGTGGKRWLDIDPALRHAERFVAEAIQRAPERGRGHRPLAHEWATDALSSAS